MLRSYLLAGLFFPLFLSAQPEVLRVGVADAPPYCIDDGEGNWYGMAVQLWQLVAEREQLRYEVVDFSHPDSLLPHLTAGDLDVVLFSTLDPGAERRVDFLQAYHHSSLGVALPKTNGLWTTLRGLFTLQFLYIVVGLSVLLLIVGVVVYLLERNRNDDQFGGERSTWQGIGSGFWWAGVTMTTIGYGDKAPRSLAGRAVAMLWMLVALAVTSSLTAAIIAATQATQPLKFPEGLRSRAVGVVDESPAENYLASEGLDFQVFDSPRAGLEAMQEKQLDAFVSDVTTLRYVIDEYDGISAAIEATDAEPEAYAFAVRQGSPLREPLDEAVIQITLTKLWREIKNTYDATRKVPRSAPRRR
ncbi:ion channel [Neolewinella litorea]|uniref:Transporter substrate-binding domain-containing protein n=1 Tax=Neolewinella litorea TaxID=2562452 RepID=A0A4V3XLP2_9BACT|nr:transporter substrate-binding domain-containing protein [Neolewinella litorea]THH41723.1 transporter substrate-binding domain-containing protein [Neolewinella litorea]